MDIAFQTPAFDSIYEVSTLPERRTTPSVISSFSTPFSISVVAAGILSKNHI
jgi:hypothetical protein